MLPHTPPRFAPNNQPPQIHHDAKHPKLPYEPDKCTNTHELTGGVTVAGVAVRGSTKKKKDEK